MYGQYGDGGGGYGEGGYGGGGYGHPPPQAFLGNQEEVQSTQAYEF